MHKEKLYFTVDDQRKKSYNFAQIIKYISLEEEQVLYKLVCIFCISLIFGPHMSSYWPKI